MSNTLRYNGINRWSGNNYYIFIFTYGILEGYGSSLIVKSRVSSPWILLVFTM